MRSRNHRASLKHALDLCDQLCLLRPGSEPGKGRTAPLRATSALRKRKEILSYLKSRPLPGCLGETGRQHRLSPREMVVVLMLLRARVVDGQLSLRGRELLGTLFDSTFQLLWGTELLDAASRLFRSGAIVPSGEPMTGPDVLDQDFRLSDSLYDEVCREIHNRPAEPQAAPTPLSPYPGNMEFLLDLRRLSVLYQRRAARLYQMDAWQESEGRVEESLEFLAREIERQSDTISETLEQTPSASSFPIVRFQSKHRLDEKELVIAVTLLFQELLFGHSFLEAVELVKLVSGDEVELIENRHLLSKASRLVRTNIVHLEEPIADREFVAEAHLSDWALEAMIGEVATGPSMDKTARRRFQKYLHQLEDSDDFYKNLKRRPS